MTTRTQPPQKVNWATAVGRQERITGQRAPRRHASMEKENMDEQAIIEGLKPVCQCQGIKKKVFLQHIASGISTVHALQQITGAGTGSCKGKQCTPRIEELVQRSLSEKGIKPKIKS